MYLLDTNIVSELHRQKPHGAVVAWLESIADKDLFLSTVTLAEIQSGIELTRDQNTQRAKELEDWLDSVSTINRCISLYIQAPPSTPLRLQSSTLMIWTPLPYTAGLIN